jgi:hypothetical protein
MEHPARTLWTSLPALAYWIDQNCKTCRWRYEQPPFLKQRPYCPLPDHAPTAYEKNSSLKPPYPLALFGRRYTNSPDEYTTAPLRCASRKDRRGRPTSAK